MSLSEYTPFTGSDKSFKTCTRAYVDYVTLHVSLHAILRQMSYSLRTSKIVVSTAATTAKMFRFSPTETSKSLSKRINDTSTRHDSPVSSTQCMVGSKLADVPYLHMHVVRIQNVSRTVQFVLSRSLINYETHHARRSRCAMYGQMWARSLKKTLNNAELLSLPSCPSLLRVQVNEYGDAAHCNTSLRERGRKQAGGGAKWGNGIGGGNGGGHLLHALTDCPSPPPPPNPITYTWWRGGYWTRCTSSAAHTSENSPAHHTYLRHYVKTSTVSH